jgi:deazaflavin-dependent oxidoreductase (nitroreductase family)
MLKLMMRLIFPIFVKLYRLTNGKAGGRVQGLPVLLLTTTGRKTGAQRDNLLGYFEQDGAYVVTATNAGMDTHPAWYHNLRANPQVTVRIKERSFEATAEAAQGEQRQRLWERFVQLSPGYAYYEKRTKRTIPVVLLRPGR